MKKVSQIHNIFYITGSRLLHKCDRQKYYKADPVVKISEEIPEVLMYMT
jgi:hypothetical protein